MAIVSAFIGRSFNKREETLWFEIRKILDSLKPMGFSWEDADEAEAEPISDKVKQKIERNDLFIGILTRGEPIIAGRSFFKGKYCLWAKVINCLASYWIIQESGYAIGRGKKVTFLIEEGLQIPGGLNNDFEYIAVDRTNLSETIIKITQIISNEIATKIRPSEKEVPGGKVTELIPLQKGEAQNEQPVQVTEEDEGNLRKLIDAIDKKDFSVAKKHFDLLLETGPVKANPTLEIWCKVYYYKKLYLAGQREALDQVRAIADENPTNQSAIKSLLECFEYYDQTEEAIETIESFLKREPDIKLRFKLSLLLSNFEFKLKKYEPTRKRLSEFLAALDSNADRHLVYKTLGDAYKEQGDKNIACYLYEMALKYDPTDLSLRFQLAYSYGEIEKAELSVYHYKVYLNTDQDQVVLNNLGMEYEKLLLLGKSVSALRKADVAGETLSSSNLARMFLEKGFYDETETVLKKAQQQKDHHRNVEYYLNELKASIEGEDENEKRLVEEAKEYRDFALEFANAISTPFDKYESIKGLWTTNYGELQELRIQVDSPPTLTGMHEQEIVSTGGLLAILPRSKQESTKKVKQVIFTGTITNRGDKIFNKNIIP
jgi:tetratricopeptide (TPR) repeat protein